MSITISERANSIQPSPTIAVSTKAAKLRAEGHDIINLAVGEPDFDTPEHVKEAAIHAIRDGFTKYTAVGGTKELVNAIVNKFRQENNLHYDANQILVSNGCKHSIYNAMQALLGPGDEAIVPAPYWVSYPDMIRLAGATPIIIHSGDDCKITPQQLADAITSNTRLFVINSPSNPTGICYSEKELIDLGNVLMDYANVVIATDDIYEHILWGNRSFKNIINACPELQTRAIVMNGVSKAYAMTGWRIGYAAGPAAIINAMRKIQSQSTSNPNSIAQVAAQVALEGDQTCIQSNTRLFKERHDFLLAKINQIADIYCRPSEGTFYMFPNMQAVIDHQDDIQNDIQLGEWLLEKAKIATVPGSAFGAPGYMRFSFATSMEQLEKAVQRLSQALSN